MLLVGGLSSIRGEQPMTANIETNPYIVISGRLTVPRDKPTIKRILRVTNIPRLDKGFAKENIIIFSGNLHIKIQYSDSHRQSSKAYFCTYNIPYTHFINFPNHPENVLIKLKVISEFQEFSILDERVLNAYVILRINKFEEYKAD